MQSHKKHLKDELLNLDAEAELTSPFVEEVSLDLPSRGSENIKHPTETLQLESPFLDGFDNEVMELNDSEIQESEAYWDEDMDQEEALAEEMADEEEVILTITEDGFGKRSSAYGYRISKGGGKGIDSMDVKRGKELTQVISTIPVVDTDQLVMVSDGGQLIRLPVDGISFTGRSSRGVTLFRVAEKERVVSVTRFRDVDGAEEGEEGEAAVDPETPPESQVESPIDSPIDSPGESSGEADDKGNR